MRTSSQPSHEFDPTQRADAATKAILRQLLDTLLANLDGVRSNEDPERLHDLRVATRRTRSALTQVKSVFPDELVEDFKTRFAWLQQVTSPLRDLDVYLLAFDDYQRCLPSPMRPHLEPLRLYLSSTYEEERRRLVAALDSDTFTQLVQDWRTFLDAPVPQETVAARGPRPVKEVADKRIWALARRVRREGRGIRPDSPPEDLHELRKSCKKLRYLMEFFQSLYPKAELRRSIKLLKRLLDELGGFQDLAVQVDHLTELAQGMRDEGRAATETLLAMGALIAHLLQRQQSARDDFDRVFAAFVDKGHQGSLRALFAAGD